MFDRSRFVVLEVVEHTGLEVDTEPPKSPPRWTVLPTVLPIEIGRFEVPADSVPAFGAFGKGYAMEPTARVRHVAAVHARKSPFAVGHRVKPRVV